MKLQVTAGLLGGLALALPSIAQPEPGEGTCSTSASYASAEGSDIVDTAVAAGSFKTLAAALQAGGLVETLKGKGPFTVFAPTDEAFAALPKGTLEKLLEPENKDLLVGILTYHVVPGAVMAKDVVKLDNAATVGGQRVDIAVEEGQVRIDGAMVVKADIHCSNGVIHVVDSVLMPSTNNIVETAANAGTFQTLIAAAKAAGLAETLAEDGPFTVFAPTDAAFAKLPEGTIADLLKPENKDALASILKLHVVSGRVYSDQVLEAGSAKTLLGQKLSIRSTDKGVRIGSAGLVKADIEASNGVVHVIDSVLLPE